MINRRSLFFSVALSALIVPSIAKAAYLPFTKSLLNALDYGVKGDGVTNDASAINTFLNTCIAKNASAYFPNGKTYVIGANQIVVPDNLIVLSGPSSIFNRNADPANPADYNSYTGAMIALGNRSDWIGGNLNNSAIFTTSTSSNTIGTGAKAFTVPAGLPITPGTTFLRAWSAGTPSAKMEGVVASYVGTTLTLTSSFTNGSGTYTDWNITIGAIYQSPMVLHGVDSSTVSNVRITGYWYVGIILDGWNPSTGGSLNTSRCTIYNCRAESVQNRAFYLYGNTSENVFQNCYVNGGSGVTDYGFNTNPANVVGSVNLCQWNKFIGCDIAGAAYQGIAISDLSFYNTISNCTASSINNAAGVGFLIQLANGHIPQYNIITGCSANACTGQGFYCSGSNYTNSTGCTAVGCGIGFQVAQSGGLGGAENSFQNITANANTTGASIGAGSNNTLLTGRSVGNTANLSDSGTGTVSVDLITV